MKHRLSTLRKYLYPLGVQAHGDMVNIKAYKARKTTTLNYLFAGFS